MSSTYLILNTDDSYTNEPDNASFQISNSLQSNFFTKISLNSVILPNVVYPINSNNNTIVFEEDGDATDLVATITPGAYNPTELATEIKTRMDASGANVYTISYDTNTYKYTFTTDGTSLRFTSDTTASKLIGVDVANSTFTASIVSDYPIRLDGSQYIDIISSIPSNNITSDNKPIYKRIPLAVSFGEILFYQSEVDDWLSLRQGNLISFDIRIVDDAGNAFVMPKNASIQYSFRLS